MTGFVSIYSKKDNNADQLKNLMSFVTQQINWSVETELKEYCDDRFSICYYSYLKGKDLSPKFLNTDQYLICLDGNILFENERHLDPINDREVQHDLEQLYFMYNESGLDAIQKQNGIYNLIIYDKLARALVFSTDRYGYRNLYYAENSNYFIISNEYKLIVNSGLISKTPNEQAIYDLHLYHFIVGEKTLLKEISLFPYGNSLIVKGKNLRWEKYWEYPRYTKLFENNLEDLADQSYNKIIKTVKRITDANSGKISLSLSGGLDSRMIAAMLSKLEKNYFMFNIGSKTLYESKIAKNIANEVGGDFLLVDSTTSRSYKNIIREGCILTDCQYSPGQFIFFDYVKLVSQLYPDNIVLHGLGMDVLFRIHTSLSYEQYKKKNQYDHNDKKEMLERGFLITGKYLIKRVFNKNVSEAILTQKSLSEEIEKYPCEDLQHLYQFFYFNNRGRRYVLGSPYSHKLFCGYLFPGMDYELFDFALKLPKELRWQSTLYRHVFLKYFNKLAKIPYSWTGVPLNQWKSQRNKKTQKIYYYLNRLSRGALNLGIPQTSLDVQYRSDNEFYNFVNNTLKDKKATERGFYTLDAIDNLLKEIKAGKNYSSLVSTILGVELFFRQHIN